MFLLSFGPGLFKTKAPLNYLEVYKSCDKSCHVGVTVTMDCSTQIYNLGLSLKTPMKGVQVSLDGLKSSNSFCLFVFIISIH